jgi:uncharacterized membrane protein YdjX (TVP38/TMEM64 family)
MKVMITTALPLVLIVSGLVYFTSQEGFIDPFTAYIHDQNIYVSYGAYILLLIISVVIAPVTIAPLIPLVTVVFGPLLTTLLTIFGWTTGSAIAFLLARYAGRPLLEKFISFKKIDELLKKLPAHSQFVSVILLHVVLPSELVSYTFGLTKSLSFTKYFVATLVGTSWSAFAISYGSTALLEGDIYQLAQIVGVSIVIFSIAWYLLRRTKKSK